MSRMSAGKIFESYKRETPKKKIKKSTQTIVNEFLPTIDTSLPKYFHFLNAGYDTDFEHFDYEALKIILRKIDEIYDNIEFDVKII